MTGVRARIVVALGAMFPMIRAHKVLAAYACLVPRLVSGRFDVARQRAVWPSTGNYCRGGVAISRILGCRGVAVLPAGMSAERFEWLGGWAASPEDIVRTPGTESSVKAIYDKCAELSRDPANVVINQFSEFANYLGHWCCTGPALGAIFERLSRQRADLRLAAVVAASGSAGTLAAGDYLKDPYGARIAVVEAVECPTLLNNGYGEHRQGGCSAAAMYGSGDPEVALPAPAAGREDRAARPTARGQVHGHPRLGIVHAAREEINYFEGSWPPDGVRIWWRPWRPARVRAGRHAE